jgi:hypothetical protein
MPSRVLLNMVKAVDEIVSSLEFAEILNGDPKAAKSELLSMLVSQFTFDGMVQNITNVDAGVLLKKLRKMSNVLVVDLREEKCEAMTADPDSSLN